MAERITGDDERQHGSLKEAAPKREAALRDILDVISRSRDDEKPVFDAILDSASRLCDAPMAGLHIADAARTSIRLVAHLGLPKRALDASDFSSPIDSQNTTAVATREGVVVHSIDLADDDLYRQGDRNRVAAVDVLGARTALIVPLLSHNVGIGCVWIFRREVKPYTDDEIALFQSFAAQAVIAIENGRQFRALQASNAELQSRLEREVATREILHVISQSRSDERPVFDVILRNALKLCDAPFGGVFLYNEARTHFLPVASQGARTDWLETFRKKPPPADPSKSMMEQAAVERAAVQVDDVKDTDLYRGGEPSRVAVVDVEGMRTAVTVPMFSQDECVGVICLYRRVVQRFAEDQIELVRTFAAQAVIAIENARQFRELQARLKREAATREILEVISRSRADEVPVFDAILENATRLCEAPLAYLQLCDADRKRLIMVAHKGARTGWVDFLAADPLSIDPDKSASARAFTQKQVIQVEDLASDALYHEREPHRVQAVETEGVRTFLAVPLIRDEEAVGIFTLYRREVAPFSDDDVALVQSFAAQAVIAIENVRQFKALESLNAELGDRVEEQVGEIERMGRLKRFLPAAVADTVVSRGTDDLLSSHRALLGVLFCDIRGFTAFCETAEPEETIEVLQTYHQEMGKLIADHGAGVDHRMGDGIMVLFNDPLPCHDPAGSAVRLAVAMRAQMTEICRKWKRLGYRLGFGVGISLGYATVGMVGYEGRYDYTASGTAVNLAARLSDLADDGEVLLSPRAYTAVEDDFIAEPRGEVRLKGIREPVPVYRLVEDEIEN